MLLLLAGASMLLHAQNADSSAAASDSIITDRAHAQEWISHIETGWRVHEGDDPVWASPAFDDSAWESAELDDLGPARPGWRWYRLHITLLENHPDLSMLLYGGDGAYELYVNGARVQGPVIRSSLGISRPTERAIPLDVPGTDVEIALRTHVSPSFAAWRLTLFMMAGVGTPDAIEARRQAFQSDRLYSALPSIFINLLLIVAGLTAFALRRSQSNRAEYLWLGLYLLLQGIAYTPAGRRASLIGQLPLQRSPPLHHRHRSNRVHIQLWRPACQPLLEALRSTAVRAPGADLAHLAGRLSQRNLCCRRGNHPSAGGAASTRPATAVVPARKSRSGMAHPAQPAACRYCFHL
jgi:hypothetical protein